MLRALYSCLFSACQDNRRSQHTLSVGSGSRPAARPYPAEMARIKASNSSATLLFVRSCPRRPSIAPTLGAGAPGFVGHLPRPGALGIPRGRQSPDGLNPRTFSRN